MPTTPIDPPLSPISDRAEGRRLAASSMPVSSSVTVTQRSERQIFEVPRPVHCTECTDLPPRAYASARKPRLALFHVTVHMRCPGPVTGSPVGRLAPQRSRRVHSRARVLVDPWVFCRVRSVSRQARGGGDRRDEIGPGDALLLQAVCKQAIKCRRGVC